MALFCLFVFNRWRRRAHQISTTDKCGAHTRIRKGKERNCCWCSARHVHNTPKPNILIDGQDRADTVCCACQRHRIRAHECASDFSFPSAWTALPPLPLLSKERARLSHGVVGHCSRFFVLSHLSLIVLFVVASLLHRSHCLTQRTVSVAVAFFCFAQWILYAALNLVPPSSFNHSNGGSLCSSDAMSKNKNRRLRWNYVGI